MAWESLCNEVAFLTQHPEVGFAISDTTAPVPGYLFGEINAITYVESGSNCKPLVNFLVTKMEPSVPLVSVKVLKLLLYLVKNGHSEMIEEIKFHEVELKKAMGFHGPPDDLHGKTFYENIRKMAKELLEYVFSEDKKINESLPNPCQSELTGYGSNASSKLPGFGFTVKSQKSVSEKLSEGISNFVEKMLPSAEKDVECPVPSHFDESLPQYKPLIISKSVPECEQDAQFSEPPAGPGPPSRVQLKKKTNVYRPGRPGGGWDDSEGEDEEEPALEAVPEEITQRTCTSADSVDFSKIELKEVIADWSEEQKIVDEFVINEDATKMKYSEISALSKRCSCLNCDKVLNFLAEKFYCEEENIQLRALIFTEYLVFHDIVSLESLLRVVLPAVQDLSKKTEAPCAVKIKAKKIFLIIERLNKVSLQRHSQPTTEGQILCRS